MKKKINQKIIKQRKKNFINKKIKKKKCNSKKIKI